MIQLTSIDGRFQIDGKDTFLRAGEYHYFRVDPEFWEKDLRLLKNDGRINVISTYVPWIFHEIYEDYFDFNGDTHPRRDIKKFLKICRKLKLPVIFRPGPFIYSEYQGFGIPLWIADLYPEVVVRRVDGTLDVGENHFNVTLNHPLYIELVWKWYSKIKEELGEFFEDPIIIFQLDNETGLMYNFNVGSIDFNEYTVKYFQQWLEEQFGDPQTLSVYCLESYISFDEVTPPEDGLNVARSMIWQSFFEDWIVLYLENLREMVMELDIPLLFAVNEQSNYFNPSNPAKKAPIAEIYGYNVTTKTSRFPSISDVPFGNSITPSIFKGYLQPEYQALFASELGCGWFDPRVRVKNIATVQLMMGSIAHGAKGICLYVVRDGADIEGEKYHYQSMISHKGKKQKRFKAVQKVYEFVEKLGEELVESEEIYDEVAFASYAMNHRIIPGDFDSTGKIIQPIKIINLLAEYGIFGMLLANGYNPLPIALERIALKDMRQLKAIFVHNRGAIIKADYTKLLEYVKDGGNLITGPNFPVMTEHGFPLNTQKLFPAVITKQKTFGKNANFLKLAAAYLGFNLQRGRIRRYNRFALYHLEMTERQNILRSWRPWGPFAKTRGGKRFHIDYFAREFMWQKEKIDPVLTLRNKTIGYRLHLGKGTNTVFGTPLGARYVIDAFYQDPKEIKIQNKEFLEELLSYYGIKKTFDADVELEIVGRYNKEKQSLLVFLLNRGRKKEGTLKILIPAKTRLPKDESLKIDVLYSYSKSEIKQTETTLDEMEQKGLAFKIKKDDCLVLRFSPKTPEKKSKE
ncbi:MAG: beta-galactosidase [Candidatus Heimdallarchaeota archaeon]|nr:beta-galactosidase [Candidatus Heimdallarchaeota archaeon]